MGIELPVLYLRWALGVEGVSTVLTGPRSLEQLEQNFEAVDAGPLHEEVEARLEQVYNMCPHRPFEEPAGCRLEYTDYWGPAALR